MKIMTLATAALVAVAGLAPGIAAPAAAQRTVITERTVRHEGPRVRHRVRQVCTWKIRNHHRVRICRTVRR